MVFVRSIAGRTVASPWGDGDFDGGVRPEMIAVMSMMLREPVANTTPNLGDKIEVALLGQVSEIADQICDGVLFNGAAALLKNRERLRGGGDVFGFVDHAPLDYTIAYATGVANSIFLA